MATTFPTALDTPLTNPTSTNPLSAPPHDIQHTQANDSIAALEAKVGIDNSAVTTSLDYKVRQQLVGRNRIVNGAMKLRQRGNGPFTANAYGIDQFLNYESGSSSVTTANALAVAAISGVVENGFHFRAVVTSAAAAGNYSFMGQRIEGVETLAGQTATLSFYAKADAARPIAVELVQGFGTGGSPSASVTAIGAQKFTLSTAWVRYTATIAIPTISGKTLGTGGNDRLDVNLWFDAGSTYNARTATLGQQSGTFDIWGVQLEAGANATPFEQEHVSVTTAKCQRYYVNAPYGSGVVQGAAAATRILVANLPMRAVPTVLSFSGAFIFDGVVNPAVTSITAAYGTGPMQFDVGCSAATLTAGRPALLNGTIFTLSAEL